MARPARFHVPHIPGWAVIGLATLLLTLSGFAVRGFGDNGLRFGSELAWRFTSLIYFAAVTAGPLSRLIPWQGLRLVCEGRRQLIWGFCASFCIFLASVLVPNTFASPDREGLTASMTLFELFGFGLTLVVAYVASRRASNALSEPARRAILGLGMAYFWLTYTLTGLAHLSGPHRPDGFYGFSVSLMVLALLLRFADGFAGRFRARRPAA